MDNFISELNKEFVQEKKLKEPSGLVHDYLFLTIDFFLTGKVVFSMFEYLEDIVLEAPLVLKIGPKHKTPASIVGNCLSWTTILHYYARKRNICFIAS